MKESDPSAPLLLFVVDDEPATLLELERILRRDPAFEVAPFSSPERALEAARERPPDLALLDLRLPGMDGLALLKRLLEIQKDLMAIVMTGYGEAETARQARETGALDFVEKPLDLPYLLVVLRQLGREARLRKTLRTGAELFRKVLDLMPDGLVLTDEKGTPLFANNLGKVLLQEAGAQPPGIPFVREGRTFVLQRHASGNRVLLHWMDLTAALERERFEAHKRMARFLAHEIRNPLTPMRLWLQELEASAEEGKALPEGARRAVAVLEGQVDRLAALVSRLQNLGREEPAALAPLPAAAVLEEVAEALDPLARNGGVEVRLAVEAGLEVLAEEGTLYELLFNLLRNAVEASAERGGTVEAGGRREGEEARLWVADGAGGLPPEVAASPFTPYLTTKAGGTGLGLVLCRDLALRLGGRLELHNRPGEGLRAEVVLKAAPLSGRPRHSR
ncbi:MAG: response regulator [Acidobacteriota bacterium]